MLQGLGSASSQCIQLLLLLQLTPSPHDSGLALGVQSGVLAGPAWQVDAGAVGSLARAIWAARLARAHVAE